MTIGADKAGPVPTAKPPRLDWVWRVITVLGIAISVATLYYNKTLPDWLKLLLYLAILGFLGYLLWSVVAWRLDRRINARLREAWDQQVWSTIDRRVEEHLTKAWTDRYHLVRQLQIKGLEEAYLAVSQVYGFAYEYQKLSCSVHNDGSATVARSCKLVAYSEVSKFIVYLHLPERPGRAPGAEPVFTDVKPEGTTLRISKKVTEATEHSFVVEVSPPLEAGQSVEFRVTEHVEERLFVAPENPNPEHRSKPYDYFCWDIFHPTASLELFVDLPPDMAFSKPEVDVWYAMSGSEIRHEEEYKRAKKHLSTATFPHSTIEFAVDNPIFSLSYVVQWTPEVPAANA